MSNAFDISDKPEILANLVQILSNASALATIQTTGLPDLKTQNINIKAVVDAIANPQLPNIAAQNTNIKAVVDAIQPDQFLSVSVSDTVIVSADIERTVVGVDYTKVKEIIVALPGEYRISFDLKSSDAGNAAYGRIYVNGVAFGTEQSNDTVDYVNKSEDLLISPDDAIQLYLKHAFAGQTSYAQNLKIKGTIGTPGAIVITD